MRNPLETSLALKALANYLDRSDRQSTASFSPDRENRRRAIREVRQELDNLSTEARSNVVTYFQFQAILERLRFLGEDPPEDLVSDIMFNLYER